VTRNLPVQLLTDCLSEKLNLRNHETQRPSKISSNWNTYVIRGVCRFSLPCTKHWRHSDPHNSRQHLGEESAASGQHAAGAYADDSIDYRAGFAHYDDSLHANSDRIVVPEVGDRRTEHPPQPSHARSGTIPDILCDGAYLQPDEPGRHPALHGQKDGLPDGACPW
jgi:hypothetical protein